MIKAVIFDMDGLMFDTESAYTRVHEVMAQQRGKIFTPEVKSRLMGKRAPEVMELLAAEWGSLENSEQLLSEQDEKLIAIYKDSVEIMPGLIKLLQFLKVHNIRTCIGTSSRRFLVDILLERHGLQNSFEHIVSGDMVNRGKPHPDIFDLCLVRLGLAGEEVVVLEDSQNGVLAAKQAQCNVIAIPSIQTIHEDFKLADLVVPTLDDSKITYFIKED